MKNYYEERGQGKRNCEIDRMVQGCTGIRRSTGQHPGGIIVLPLGEDINSFTPVQHPANDMTTDIVTTHFDYHSIDHNLLKLDILGHDDPTMIKKRWKSISVLRRWKMNIMKQTISLLATIFRWMIRG